MNSIAAIETRYNGILFRSRIEARWAVFFDVLGIKFEYETEKFATSLGRYIPDFYLPDFLNEEFWARESGAFLEVKGAPPNEEELQKCFDLKSATRITVAVAHGSSFREILRLFNPPHQVAGFRRESTAVVQCPYCGKFSFGYSHFKNNDSAEVIEKNLEEIKNHWTDGGPMFFDEYHSCEEQSKMDYFSGSARFPFERHIKPARSPSIDIATEAAKSMRFEQPGAEAHIKTLAGAVRILHDSGVYCFPRQRDYLIAMALNAEAEEREFEERHPA